MRKREREVLVCIVYKRNGGRVIWCMEHEQCEFIEGSERWGR